MAEENVLEEDNQNLEDDNLLDELDEATGAEDEPTDESGAKSSGNPIDKIKGLMKNRRVVIIAGSVLVVLVLFMAVFVLTGSDEEDLMADAMLNQQEAPKFDSSNIRGKRIKHPPAGDGIP